ncbi:MAG: hypothetical protein ACI8RZ_003883 [Myxococcota bacterium]|jgi:hypothetical protein
MASPTSSLDQIDTLSFETVGIRWTVRSPDGERVRFDKLAALQEALEDGELTLGAELTFDGVIWRTLSEIPDLRAYFWQVWKRAKRGEVQANWMPTIGGIGGEIQDDAPTTIALPDDELSRAIQEALARELMARSKEKHQPLSEPVVIPPVTTHIEPPPPSDVPGILRAMGVSLVLILLSLGMLLSLP